MINMQQQIDGIKPFVSDLDTGNNQIINVGHQRNLEHNNEHENDVVTAKFLYGYAKIADRKYMKTNEDMQKHRIKGLANSFQMDDAVTLQYVAARIAGLTDEIRKLKEEGI